MKKDKTGINILIGVSIVIVVIIAIAIIQNNKETKELSTYKTAEIYSNDNNTGEIIETDINLFKEMKNSDKVSIIYIGRPTCTYCIEFYPILEEVALEYNLDVYYTNTDEWNSNDVNKILYKTLRKFEGTPTTLIMYKGKQASVKVGYMEKGDLVNFLKNNKLIRE